MYGSCGCRVVAETKITRRLNCSHQRDASLFSTVYGLLGGTTAGLSFSLPAEMSLLQPRLYRSSMFNWTLYKELSSLQRSSLFWTKLLEVLLLILKRCYCTASHGSIRTATPGAVFGYILTWVKNVRLDKFPLLLFRAKTETIVLLIHFLYKYVRSVSSLCWYYLFLYKYSARITY